MKKALVKKDFLESWAYGIARVALFLLAWQLAWT